MFCKCQNLKKTVLNEGLEVLGTDEYPDGDRMWLGVFEDSSIEKVELPSTLRRIEYNTFRNCKNLKSISLPETLEHINKWCF